MVLLNQIKNNGTSVAVLGKSFLLLSASVSLFLTACQPDPAPKNGSDNKTTPNPPGQPLAAAGTTQIDPTKKSADEKAPPKAEEPKEPATNKPPTVVALGAIELAYGTTKYVTVQATDPDNDAMTYEFSTLGEKQAKQTLDPKNPQITLVAAADAVTETFPAVVIVTDKWGKKTTSNFTVQIKGKSILNQGTQAACDLIADVGQKALCKAAGQIIIK